MRINTEALKISEFAITALLAPFLETKFFDIKKAIKKGDSKKIAAGCLDFFTFTHGDKRKIYHAHYSYRHSYRKFLYV